MTDVTIKYTDGQEIKYDADGIVVAQSFIHLVIQTHRDQRILETIKGITIHQEKLTDLIVFPVPGGEHPWQ